MHIIFGTGGETQGGSLWVISLSDLRTGRMENARTIYTDCCKGIMVPPVLVDLTGDKTEDIVMAMFNSTVIAFNGFTYEQLWKWSSPGSETYSTPAIGRYNTDDVPDFFVTYQVGPGFPVYYYTRGQVLDGRTGQPLLVKPLDMLVGTQSSPLTLSTDGLSDLFVYWHSSCVKHNTTTNTTSTPGTISSTKSTSNQEFDPNQLVFKVAPGTNVHETSRADFCGLRFNASLFTQLVALSPNNSTILYDSRMSYESERTNKVRQLC